jgi:hypothetical protein
MAGSRLWVPQSTEISGSVCVGVESESSCAVESAAIGGLFELTLILRVESHTEQLNNTIQETMTNQKQVFRQQVLFMAMFLKAAKTTPEIWRTPGRSPDREGLAARPGREPPSPATESHTAAWWTSTECAAAQSAERTLENTKALAGGLRCSIRTIPAFSKKWNWNLIA